VFVSVLREGQERSWPFCFHFKAIGRIAKVVPCSVNLQSGIVTVIDGGKNLTTEEKSRIVSAAQKAPQHNWDISSGHKFYLCDEWATTNFLKSSPRGIQGHRYFELREELGANVPIELDQIAAALSNHTWT